MDRGDCAFHTFYCAHLWTSYHQPAEARMDLLLLHLILVVLLLLPPFNELIGKRLKSLNPLRSIFDFVPLH